MAETGQSYGQRKEEQNITHTPSLSLPISDEALGTFPGRLSFFVQGCSVFVAFDVEDFSIIHSEKAVSNDIFDLLQQS